MAQDFDTNQYIVPSIVTEKFLSLLRVEEPRMTEFLFLPQVAYLIDLIPQYGDAVFRDLVNLYASWSSKSIQYIINEVSRYSK